MKIGINNITKEMEGHYIRLRSNVNGQVWTGKVKAITIKPDQRRILFEDGVAVTAYQAFDAILTYLDN